MSINAFFIWLKSGGRFFFWHFLNCRPAFWAVQSSQNNLIGLDKM